MNRTTLAQVPRFLRFSIRPAFSALLLAGVLRSSEAHAATTLHYWTGGSATSGNWSAGANWLGGVAPTGGDQRLIFDKDAAHKVNTNNLPAGTTFESVWIVDSGYNIYGNSLRTTLVRMDDTTGTSTFRPDIIANSDLTLYVEQAAARLVIGGDVILTADNLLFPATAAGDVTISGVISGTGNLIKSGTGDVSLSGLGANTFVGDTFVYGGILRLNRYNLGPGLTLVGTTALTGDLTIGDFSSTLIGNVVALGNDNQIADTSVVSIQSTGSLELSDENDVIGELRLRGGTVLTGNGLLSVDGPILADPSAVVPKNSLIAGRLNLGGRGDGTQTIDVAQGVVLTISAQISGVSTATLIKADRGELFLSASNTFSGDVEINGGTVTISHGSALGAATGVTKASLGTLAIQGTIGIPEPLEVPGPAGTLMVESGSPSWLGSVVLNDDLNIYVPTNSTLTILGLISGPAGFYKYGPGTLQFKTTYTNTYGGVSRVAEGDMILDGVLHQPVIPGPLVIGNSTHSPGGERVSLIKNNQIADNAPITLNKSGLLALNGMVDTVGALTFYGGAVETTSFGLLTLNGDILVHATNQTAAIRGQLSLGGAMRQIDTAGAGAAPDLLIAAAIADGAGSGGMTKLGDGVLTLGGSNAFTGVMLVNDGELVLENSFALGATNSGALVHGHALLTVQSNVHIPREPLTLNSPGSQGLGALRSRFGTNSWLGDILLGTNTIVNVVDLTDVLSLAGAIGSPSGASLTKVGAGTLVFSGNAANSYGDTLVNAGTLELLKTPFQQAIPGVLIIGDGVGGALADTVRVRNKEQIANSSPITIDSSGLLQIEGVAEAVGSMAGTGAVRFLNQASLAVGGNEQSTTFAGSISGPGSFQKVGGGTLTLTAAHAYSGETALSEGSLIVHGNLSTSSRLVLNQPVLPANMFPAVLGGTGLVPRLVSFPGGIVAPGASPGRLTVQGELALSNDVVRMELNGTVAGTSYDQLRVSGPVILDGSRLELSLGFTPAINDAFTLIRNESVSPTQGTFLGLAQGSYFAAGGLVFYIEYNAGVGANDVVVTRVAPPPPSIGSINPVNSEQMKILGLGVPGLSYLLEATFDLNAPISWTPLGTTTANSLGIYEFIDDVKMYPQRFYRIQ